MTTSETSVIKTALKEKYGKDKVKSVRRGSGTAYGWITITLSDKTIDWRDAEKEAVKALSLNGMRASTYLSDDGYGTEDNCINVNYNY